MRRVSLSDNTEKWYIQINRKKVSTSTRKEFINGPEEVVKHQCAKQMWLMWSPFTTTELYQPITVCELDGPVFVLCIPDLPLVTWMKPGYVALQPCCLESDRSKNFFLNGFSRCSNVFMSSYTFNYPV